MAAEREVRLEPLLESGQVELLETPCLRRGERLVQEVCERRSTPERKRCACGLACPVLGVGARGLDHEPLEPHRVHRLGIDAQLIAPAAGHDLRPGVLDEQLAELGHVELHHLGRARGLVLLAPEPLDQAVDRDGGVGVEGEESQHRTLLRPAEPQRPPAEHGLDRAENANLQVCLPPATSVDPVAAFRLP
jgi:hypothetical protein